MIGKTLLVVWIAAGVVGALEADLAADDLIVPPWRGGELSVMAAWDFIPCWCPPSSDFPPGIFSAVGDGDPDHELWSGSGTFERAVNMDWWLDDDSYGLIALAGGGSMGLTVQNWIDQEQEKRLQIQVAFGGAGVPSVSVIEAWDESAAYQGALICAHRVDDNHVVEEWVVQPNPDWETIDIHVPEGTWVSGIVVDTISIPHAIPGDANLNGTVDDSDLSCLLNNWDQSSKTWGQGDFTGEGLVDDSDLNLTLSNWTGSAGDTAPEPAAFSLLSLGFCLCVLRRRARS